MNRRNTIQKSLVLDAVTRMRRHVTADEVAEFIRTKYPSIGKGTVYRNLSILAQEQKIRRVEIPNGPDCFDFTLHRHYHARCVDCGSVMDVLMDEIHELEQRIRNQNGFLLLDYDILFKGICPECQAKRSDSYNE